MPFKLSYFILRQKVIYNKQKKKAKETRNT